MAERVVITGGAGFVGSTLAAWLCRRFQVTILDRRMPRGKEFAPVRYVECNIADFDGVRKALEGADLVIHTAIVQIPQINDERRLGYEANVLGTQNVCEAVRLSPSARGLILTGTWHTIGERNIAGVVDESFGFRPDMVEERARLYALSKIAQEVIVRLYDEAPGDKVYGIVRIGTVLGEGMPEKTAASIFIDHAVVGRPLTPYEHSMHRPMLYVDIRDVCRAFESYALNILGGKGAKSGNSLNDIVNVYHSEPITILELAEIVKKSVEKCSNGRMKPEITIVRTGERSRFSSDDKKMMKVDVTRASEFLGLRDLIHPADSVEYLVRRRMTST